MYFKFLNINEILLGNQFYTSTEIYAAMLALFLSGTTLGLIVNDYLNYLNNRNKKDNKHEN